MRLQITLLATLVVLLSLTMGTVGFSVLELEERNVDVAVAADDTDGLLALEPGPDTEFVDTNDDGELEVSLEDLDADGVNPSSTLEIGDSSEQSPAFTATNAFDQDVDLEVSVDGEEPEKDAFTLVVNEDSEELNTGDNQVVVSSLGSSEAVDFDLEFDTPAGENQDDYEIELTFEVTPSE